MLLNFSEVTIGGFLTKDVLTIKDNENLCKTTVAINSQSNPTKKVKKDVVFIEVLFNHNISKIASTLKKGDYVMLQGQLKQKIFTKDNYNFIKTYLIVSRLLNITRKSETNKENNK